MIQDRNNPPAATDGEAAVRIVDLLRERERAFVTVWTCERRIADLLHGADFPFPPPPDLPSRQRRNKGAGPRRAQTVRVRRLKSTEDAYRISLQIAGDTVTCVQDSTEVIKALVDVPAEEVCVTCIETVRLDDAGDPSPVACLWREQTTEAG